MNLATLLTLFRWVLSIANRYRSDWRAWVLALIGAILLAIAGYLVGTMPPAEPDFPVPYVPGWRDDPEEVRKTILEIEEAQGFPADFGRVFEKDPFGDDGQPVFFWQAEEKVLGKVLPSWNQGSVGSCVSFGWGRSTQDLILIQVIANKAEEWPGAEVATEPIYGGSRVEVGGGRLGGDGSTGAWAAKWVSDWGILFRKKYGQIDLTSYDTTRCRAWGRAGVPNELEPVAKEHPVKGVATVKSASQAWDAIGSGYPIAVCSNVGFQSPLKEGFCARRGSWAHCMELRGRFWHPSRGKCFVVQNSWGDYLASGDPTFEVKGSEKKFRLPQGCFCVTEADAEAILRQGDSFALSAFKGFPARRLDWLIHRPGHRLNGEMYAILHPAFVRHGLAGDLCRSGPIR